MSIELRENRSMSGRHQKENLNAQRTLNSIQNNNRDRNFTSEHANENYCTGRSYSYKRLTMAIMGHSHPYEAIAATWSGRHFHP
jgi:hypothetical protein